MHAARALIGWRTSSRSCHATPESAVEATVDLHSKTVCLNKLFGHVNMFSIALSNNDNFLNVLLFVFL